jgi:hypothetical protein
MATALLTGIGLAAPTGLNAYLPLLVLALSDRFTSAISLSRPYSFLSSSWGIGIITLLLTIEIVVDKVPGLDHANDLIQSPIRPAAGAVLTMAATSTVASINPVIAMILGLLVAGSVHVAKATIRPGITLATGGIGNPLVSMAEDGAAAISAVLAIFVPLLVLLTLVLFAGFLLWAARKRQRGPLPPGAPSSSSKTSFQ